MIGAGADSSEDDSDLDPAYVDSDRTDEDDDLWLNGVGGSRAQDRCHYIRLHRPVLRQLYDALIDTGRQGLGDAFLQHCSQERFYTFVYCNTQQDFPNT